MTLTFKLSKTDVSKAEACADSAGYFHFLEKNSSGQQMTLLICRHVAVDGQ